MKNKVTDIIRIDNSLSTPIYRQIVQSVCDSIEKGRLRRNDMLPSVNIIAETFSLARGSVFTAYNDLRSSGIIDSIPGKGYFITSTRLDQKKKVFVLFSTLTPCNAMLYNGIVKNLGDDCATDLYFHRHNIRVFESIIREQAVHYNTFVIVPEVHADTASILSKLDKKHLFLLDAGFREFRKLFNGVYRNAEKELSTLLVQFGERINRYKRLFLVTPGEQIEMNVIAVFRKFSKTTSVHCEILDGILVKEIKKGDGYIIFDDCYLAEIIKYTKEEDLRIGKDIGIISYRDNILKEVVADGITTFSTDVDAMGKSIATMISTGNMAVIENPTIFVDRHSF